MKNVVLLGFQMEGAEQPHDQNQTCEKGNGCHDGGGPEDIFQPEHLADEEKEQDIQRAFMQQRQQEGLAALAHCLKYGDDNEQNRIYGRRNT